MFFVILRLIPTGRNNFYVGSNIRMWLASGIDIAKTRNIAFVLAGFGAAMTGIMISCIRYGGDRMVGGVYVLKSIAAVVVGGTALTGGTGGPLTRCSAGFCSACLITA
jgi:ribose/xylose/arabinose/galactoside ABC-type transport system permease subunit